LKAGALARSHCRVRQRSPAYAMGRSRIVDWIVLEWLNISEMPAFPGLCAPTHVARTGEIGRASVTGIEKKGKINRRVRIALGSA
jgi:Ser-tRNA(Ala) deacylase AlaX